MSTEPETKARLISRDYLSSLATSAEGIYGLILVAGMIVISRNLAGSSGEALSTVLSTLLVFFIAHVYAATVARLAKAENGGLGESLRHGIRESLGLLVLGAVPVFVLSLGVVGLLRQTDAVWGALVVDGILLGVLGWFITAARTKSFWARIGGTLLTAGCGAIMILLKVLIHH